MAMSAAGLHPFRPSPARRVGGRRHTCGTLFGAACATALVASLCRPPHTGFIETTRTWPQLPTDSLPAEAGAPSRRGSLLSMALAAGTSVVGSSASPAWASEVPAPPPDGGCVECLGVIDGLLSRCRGDLKACVASQDDRPEVFEAPWQLPVLDKPQAALSAATDVKRELQQLRTAVKQNGGRIVALDEARRYLRAEFPVELPFFGSDVDDLEWYFTPGDTIVQFRAERRTRRPDFGENRRRLEQIRASLGWDVLPVLRNRQRALFFFESPLDNFGPALYDALRPGQEPTPGEAEVLSKQGLTPEKRKEWGMRDLLANDDLGVENRGGILDAATRDFLRATCDPKLQICE